MRIKFFFSGTVFSVMTAMVLSGCNPKNNEVPVSDSFQKKLIDKDLMLQLDSNYSANNYRHINANRPRNTPDSREYWYTLEDLEGYIAYIKKEAESKNYNVVGIKIKMGQYPIKGPFDSRLNSKFYGYQTVYLVPTVVPASAQSGDLSQGKAEADPLFRGSEMNGVPGMDLSWSNPPY